MHFQHSIHQKFYEYWNKKRGKRAAPSRSDMDPIEFHKLLPNLIIYRVEETPRNYQISLVGTGLTEALGKDLTGLYLNEFIHDEQLQHARNQLDDVAINFQPRIDELDAGFAGKPHVKYSRLLLPLSSDGERADRLIGCLAVNQRPENR
ncbi:PAS domain-containing protein [Aestuariispira insulae]|uniref:PAS domain-containing protein n=1 Tax=Aestuariispira insulae TaxID=1461337 RepID=A0A3D9HWL4_9PROT|nr:PAS domain-containing protein [Aestuariispira insulae]RED53771.1 PAS domain-containing protein [Aestuariispira insulae]